MEGLICIKQIKKTAFSMQEEIDWGAVPSRLCNEMRGEERRPTVKASGGGWKGVEDGEKKRGVNRRKRKKKTKQKVRRKSGREKRRHRQSSLYYFQCECNINNV